MIEIIQQFGFKPAGSCNCGGHLVDKFKKDDYEIWIRARVYKFCIKKYNAMVTKWMPATDIEEQMASYFPKVAKIAN